MSNKVQSKFKRITDLFTQGDTCYLGDDEQGKPICVWVQKSTALQEDEARMDAQAARTRKMVEMADIRHPEVAHAHLIISEWDDDQLMDALCNQDNDKFIVGAVDDVAADEEWLEKMEYLRREPALMDEANLPDDDPRRAQFNEVQAEHLLKVEEVRIKRREKEREEMGFSNRPDLEDRFLDNHKKRLAAESMSIEARITRLYYSLRECDASKKEDGTWNHVSCDHSKMLCPSRAEIRELPEEVLVKVIEAFDNLQVGMQRVANFPAAQSS